MLATYLQMVNMEVVSVRKELEQSLEKSSKCTLIYITVQVYTAMSHMQLEYWIDNFSELWDESEQTCMSH